LEFHCLCLESKILKCCAAKRCRPFISKLFLEARAIGGKFKWELLAKAFDS
jgi:hypothetical protein